MSEIELKPCPNPWCDGEAVVMEVSVLTMQDESPFGKGFEIQCSACDNGSGNAFSLEDDAIAEWNSRPAEDALRAELAAKDAEIARLNKALDQANVWVRVSGSVLWAAAQPMGDRQNMPELYEEMERRQHASSPVPNSR